MIAKKLLSVKVPGVDKICHDMLKALDIVGLSWTTRLWCHLEVGDRGCGVADWDGVTVRCAPIIRESHCSASEGKFITRN